jgi:hypothetical protein
VPACIICLLVTAATLCKMHWNRRTSILVYSALVFVFPCSVLVRCMSLLLLLLFCKVTFSRQAIASQKLQTHLNAILTWLHKWRMQANELKSVHVTFTTRTGMRPPVHMKNVQLSCADHVKYLGLHLDGKLTWHHRIFTKRKQLDLTVTKMYWLLGRSSQLSLPNKLLLYKTILKPIWTYGIQLLGTASSSDLCVLHPVAHLSNWFLMMPSIATKYCKQSCIKTEVSV